MNLSTFIAKSMRAVQQGRARKAAIDFYRNRVYTYGYYYRSWQFDRKFGVNTRAKDLGLSKNRAALSQTIDSPNDGQNTGFGPSDPMLLKGVFEALPIRHEDYTFLDLGAGTGRVLLMASEFPFRRIIGVEFCPPVCDRALQNTRLYKSSTQMCKDFDVVCMDAQQYPIPDEPVVVFLSNPFRAEHLLRSVLDNLKRSLIANPRQIYVIYHVPRLRHVTEACEFLEKMHTQAYCDIYRNTVWQDKMTSAAAALKQHV